MGIKIKREKWEDGALASIGKGINFFVPLERMSMWFGIWPSASSTFTNEKWRRKFWSSSSQQRTVQPEKRWTTDMGGKAKNFEWNCNLSTIQFFALGFVWNWMWKEKNSNTYFVIIIFSMVIVRCTHKNREKKNVAFPFSFGTQIILWKLNIIFFFKF